MHGPVLARVAILMSAARKERNVLYFVYPMLFRSRTRNK